MASLLKSLTLPQAGGLRGFVLPAAIGGLALSAAIVAGFLAGESAATGGVNGFVEGLSSKASNRLSSIEVLAPLGFAFVAGMVSAVNPCGFAMLPAYLGLYLGSNEQGTADAHPLRLLGNALLVGLTVTSGFVLLFGVAGLIIERGVRSVVDIMPWLGFGIGIALAVAGSWLLGGGKLYSGFAARLASRIGDPGRVNVRGYFLFGLSYAVASLSCTLPIFLVVVFSTQAASGHLAAVAQFVLYALGMGMVILVLTIGMAVFKRAVVGGLRRALPLFQPLSAALMIVAGSYIVYYWLTIGDLA